MRKSFKGPKLGVHTHKEKFPTGLGHDFQSDFLCVSCKSSKETSPYTKQIMKTIHANCHCHSLKRLSRAMDTIDRNQHRVLLQGGKAEPTLSSSLRHLNIFPRTPDFWFPLKIAQWGFIRETAIKETEKEEWARVLTSMRTQDTNPSILHSTVIIAKTLLSGWQLFDLQLLRSSCPIVWAMSNQSSNAVKSCRNTRCPVRLQAPST